MKKPSSPKPRPRKTDLRTEYRFDYSESRPNRFAAQAASGAVAVLLDPDVATVFHDSESVNAFLRSVITAMPRATSPRLKAAKKAAMPAASIAR